MTSTPITTLCRDRVKYAILNAVRATSSPDIRVYCMKKMAVFNQVHDLIRLNRQLEGRKCDNLYALLYCKYFVQRHVISEVKGEQWLDENDEALKEQFKGLAIRNIASKEEFEREYLAVVHAFKGLQSPFKSDYDALNERMCARQLKESEIQAFYEGCSETEVFLEKKLSSDLKSFIPYKERFLNTLRDYRFLKGWIQTGGVVIAGALYILLK